LLQIVIVAVPTVIVLLPKGLADLEILIVVPQTALALPQIVIVAVSTVIVSFPKGLANLEI